MRSPNVVFYFALPRFFRDFRILSWWRFLEWIRANSLEWIRSKIGRTCPRNLGLFPNVNLGGQMRWSQPLVFLLSCKYILCEGCFGYTQGHRAWTNLKRRWRYGSRLVPIKIRACVFSFGGGIRSAIGGMWWVTWLWFRLHPGWPDGFGHSRCLYTFVLWTHPRRRFFV